jgi:hypothetical protein
MKTGMLVLVSTFTAAGLVAYLLARKSKKKTPAANDRRVVFSGWDQIGKPTLASDLPVQQERREFFRTVAGGLVGSLCGWSASRGLNLHWAERLLLANMNEKSAKSLTAGNLAPPHSDTGGHVDWNYERVVPIHEDNASHYDDNPHSDEPAGQFHDIQDGSHVDLPTPHTDVTIGHIDGPMSHFDANWEYVVPEHGDYYVQDDPPFNDGFYDGFHDGFFDWY